ncbi:MAG: hypothetical protein U9O94_04550, partial [Nanoarchaeota archaeon]|nr:hypothetical protein [Nanoarchaeota archaeon]
MDLKVTNKKDNTLLSRVEIEAELTFLGEPTPKKEDLKKKISSLEKSDEKLIVVKNIYSLFGAGKGNALVYIYKSEDALKKTEPQKEEPEKKP